MLKRVFLIAIVATLAGCSALLSRPPQRFPQFDEQRVVGPGSYELPQWSSDSRYLAYIDSSIESLVVYDTESENHWIVATNVFYHFSWDPDDWLTYLRYRPDLSGTPVPTIQDLHRVDLRGENDEIVVRSLHNAGDFAWFSNGRELVVLLADQDSRTDDRNIYILDANTGHSRLLLRPEDMDVSSFGSIALSPDERTLLIDGVDVNGQGPVDNEAWLIFYDLIAEEVTDRYMPSEHISSGDMDYPQADLSLYSNAAWVDHTSWFLTDGGTPGGECYNYFLFFLSADHFDSSFCIPSELGIVSEPAISPDLTRISYITTVGPGRTYVMVGVVTADLLDELGLSSE